MLEKIIEYITMPEILIAIAALIICFNLFRKNNNFFDVRNIFKEQFKIFKYAKGQLVVFYGVPLILAFASIQCRYINKEIVDNIIVVLSIIISMLFAMLSILSAYQKKDSKYTKVLDETYNSIMFECILCVISLLISFSQFFIDIYNTGLFIEIISLILYYLIFVIVLNTFIILKRMKVLYDNRL